MALAYFVTQDEYVFSGEYEHKSLYNVAFTSPFTSGNYTGKRKKKRSRSTETDVKPTPPVMRQYSLETMLYSCISAYLTINERRESGGNPIKKEEAIRILYDEVCKYADSYFTVQDKEKFTEYKRKVVAGFLTIKVAGYALSQKLKSDFSNQNIYQATRNAFRTKRKKA